MTDTDIEMAENWETYEEGQHQIAAYNSKEEMTADWQDTPEQIEIMDQEERDRLGELDGDDRTSAANEYPPVDDRTREEMDWGRETLQEQGIEAYAEMPFIRKINWDVAQ